MGDVHSLLLNMSLTYGILGTGVTTIKTAHDVHAYVQLTNDPSKTVHVRGYPGMSNEEGAAFGHV